MQQEQRKSLKAAMLLRSAALRLPKPQTNGFVRYTSPLGNPTWTRLGAASRHQSLIVNPAQQIPQILSKIMQFAFWCLTIELCSAQVFRLFTATGELEARVAVFLF